MTEKIHESPFTVAEQSALDKIRQSVTRGETTDAIAYEPRDLSLFSTIRLHSVFPGLVETPKVQEAFYQPKERILELMNELEMRMLEHEDLVPLVNNGYEVSGITSTEGRPLKIRRRIDGGTKYIYVEHYFEEKDTYPYVKSDTFTLADHGYFSRSHNYQESPQFGCRLETIALFNAANTEKFNDATIESFRHFRELIQPFFVDS